MSIILATNTSHELKMLTGECDPAMQMMKLWKRVDALECQVNEDKARRVANMKKAREARTKKCK